jgi:hypothetical protein
VLGVGLALTVATVVYSWLVLKMRIPEARQIQSLIRSRITGRMIAEA